jgi:trans-2,3-dihydro-3-hydroxyanthranilate isomerase
VPLKYAIYDVFTTDRFTGNPLAVVFDAGQLSQEAMQAIAAEFNLSETVFVLPRESQMADHKLRIFTPKKELPFAGHPTVGAAIALSEGRDKAGLILELAAGLTPCAVAISNGVAYAEFVAPGLPKESPVVISTERVVKAVNIEPHEIGFKGYGISCFGLANSFLFLPVSGLEAIAHAKPTLDLLREGFPHPDMFVFCRRSVTKEAAFHARMFSPAMGIPEDPATGSAVAALAGVIMKYEPPQHDGRHEYIIEQGFEMGRPSMIRLELEIVSLQLARIRIGGNAVKVAEGTLLV